MASLFSAVLFAFCWFTGESEALNRLTQVIPDPRQIESTSVSFAYNALGLRTSMTDAVGVTSYGYDLRNRLIEKITPQGTLNYTYDANGNVLSVQSDNANGVRVSYEYDDLDQLSAVIDPHVGRCTYSYDAVGNYRTHALANGLTTVYGYDALHRVTAMAVTNTTGLVAGYDYSLDASGQRTVVSEVGGRTLGYGYDALQRLTNETIAASSGSGVLSYRYDAVGNRLALDSLFGAISSTTHGYDLNDRLLEHTFDANGNTLAATNFNPLAGLPEPVFDQYDFRNRLVRRDTTLGGQPATLQFAYDGDGNRVRKSVNNVATHYLVDELNPTGWPQVLEELTSVNGGAPVVTRTYTWGHALLAQDQIVGTNWQVSLPLHDAHGNVRQLTDPAGNVTDAYEYDAFGNLIARAGSTPNNHLYAGEQFDPDLGLYHLRARYYNPAQGRFWTQDSFEGFVNDPPSLHKYAYAHNNPVSYIDPSGYYTLTETLAVSALAPLVQDTANKLWDGINHYSHGLAGGSELKATSYAEALFINSLAAGPGLNIGKQNFWRTAYGAPMLLNWNPNVYIPLSDCFRYEIIGDDIRIYGCPAKFDVFQFDFTSGEAYQTAENLFEPFLRAVDVAGFLETELFDTLAGTAYAESYEGNSQLFADIAQNTQNYDADQYRVDTIKKLGQVELAIATYGASAGAAEAGQQAGAGHYQDAATTVVLSVLPGYGATRAEVNAVREGLANSAKGAAITDANIARASRAVGSAEQKLAAGLEPPPILKVKLDDCVTQAKSVFSKKPIKWKATRPKGTLQNYDVFQRNDINWKRVRTGGDRRAIGLTNEEAARRYGLAPELDDGSFATLHHLGQDSRGGLVEASTRYHGVGKPGQDILHSQFGRNQPHPDFPIDRQRFDVDTREYWRFRAEYQ